MPRLVLSLVIPRDRRWGVQIHLDVRGLLKIWRCPGHEQSSFAKSRFIFKAADGVRDGFSALGFARCLPASVLHPATLVTYDS